MVNFKRLLFKLGCLLIQWTALVNAYAPKLVLFSFDGFRADYLHKELTPTMYELSKQGVQTQLMRSCYVTKTFPNHFSIVTGLYEEHHGIVNNKMYDPKFKSNFSQPNLEEKWWNDMNVHPIWNVNEQFGEDRVSASSMWPGSPVSYNGRRPKYVQRFEHGLPFTQRMDQAIDWLTLDKDPANFVLVYIDEPDETSHNNGPFSPATRKILKDLDDAVKHFLKRLEEVDLINETNIIILSDHGMSEVREDRVIDLTELCDSQHLIVSGVSPNLNLFLEDKSKLDVIYEQLKSASQKLPFKVYKTGEVPFHFNTHRRIGDIVVEADDQYEVVLKENPFPYNLFNAHQIIEKRRAEIDSVSESRTPSIDKMNIVEKFEDFLVRKSKTTLKVWGEHGYDNRLSNMKPLFLASGPAFKRKYVHMTPFINIDVYSLVCSVLHLNLDSNLKSIDRYCEMDGKSSRISKMLAPIKHTGDDGPNSSADKQSVNILVIFLLGVCSLVLLGCAFTLCTAAVSNSSYNKNRKHKLYNIDLDEDVIDIDLSQYQRTRQKEENTTYKNEEERMLINTNESLDYV